MKPRWIEFQKQLKGGWRTTGCLGFLLICCVVMWPGQAQAKPFSNDIVREAVTDVLADDRYQKKIGTSVVEKQEETYSKEYDFSFKRELNFSAEGNEVWGWFLLILLTLFILYVVFRYKKPYKIQAHKQDETGIDSDPAKDVELSDLDKIDGLAKEGDYATAIFLLLTLAIELVREQFSWQVFYALTNREILQKAQLPDETRNAFAKVVSAEELSQFAQQRVNHDVFILCRQSYVKMKQDLTGEPVQPVVDHAS